MEEARVEDLRRRVLGMWRENRDLLENARDYPALTRNARRVEASLAMMRIDLGLLPEDD